MDGWKCSTRGRVLAAKVAIAASLFPVSLSLGQTPSNPDGTTPASPAATAPAAPLAANSAPTAGAATRLAPPRQIQTDSDLKQTGFGHHDYPSSQQQYDATCPPVPTKPPPTTPAPVAPTYTPPAYAPQYAPVYAPQYAPTYAPQYAPVYAPQYAPMPPMMPQYAAPPAPPAAPSNYFLPSAPPAAPPAPPAYSAPMMPMAPVYSMPMAPAFAAPQPPAMVPGAALSNSSVSVPTSRASTRTRVRGPGPLASGLARLGERLTQLGRVRIETTQETELDTPRSLPTGGVATISTTGAVPVNPPQMPVAPPAAPVAPPEAPTPSPQGHEPHQKHSLFHHLLGDD
jgi:hypothetical protein